IEATGVALNGVNNTQVLAAIQNLIEARVGDYSLATGGANWKVVALNPAINAYTDNFSGVFRNNNTVNTGAVTVNFGGGAVSLRNDTGGLLVAGDLPVNAIVGYQYIHADGKAYVTSTVSSQALSQVAADTRYAAINDGKQPGEIFMHAGIAAPAGSLVIPTVPTNVSRTTYADLFAAIGVTHGIGNGTTTFGLPYLPEGHTLVQANGNVGASTVGKVIAHTHDETGLVVGAIGFNAYGNNSPASTVQQTGSTGGAANLAAGLKILLCIQY
ncbi:MAG: phage tail protein, partial [Gallionella sp.]